LKIFLLVQVFFCKKKKCVEVLLSKWNNIVIEGDEIPTRVKISFPQDEIGGA